MQAQNAILPAGWGAWLSPVPIWGARSRHIISQFLQGRGFPYLDQPYFQCIAYLDALREAEFYRRLHVSPHVRKLISRLGSDAHFLIGGLWWLLKQTASPHGLLASRGELARSSRQRVRNYRERQGRKVEGPPVEPGTLCIVFNPPSSDRRRPGRRSVSDDAALWALRVFQILATDHIRAVTAGRFRDWRLIGALSAEFVALPIGNVEREAVRREARRVRGKISRDLDRVRERIQWVVFDALHGPHLSRGPTETDQPIPWRRLRRQWNEMINFTPLEPTGRPVVVQIRHPSPLSPDQSLGDWFAAERKAGKVTVLNLPRPPRKLK